MNRAVPGSKIARAEPLPADEHVLREPQGVRSGAACGLSPEPSADYRLTHQRIPWSHPWLDAQAAGLRCR
jgi:hypothetical protein